MGGVYASWAGFVLIVLVLIAQFYVVSATLTLPSPPLRIADVRHSRQALWPIGGMDSEGSAVAYDFFLIWLGAPICLAMWIYAVIRFRRFKWLRLDEIDLDVGFAATPVFLRFVRARTDSGFIQTGRKSWLTVEEMRLVSQASTSPSASLQLQGSATIPKGRANPLFNLLQYRAERATAPLYIRIYRALFSK